MVTNKASVKSKTPPWPGIEAEESLTLASLFIADSNRSPIMLIRDKTKLKKNNSKPYI